MGGFHGQESGLQIEEAGEVAARLGTCIHVVSPNLRGSVPLCLLPNVVRGGLALPRTDRTGPGRFGILNIKQGIIFVYYFIIIVYEIINKIYQNYNFFSRNRIYNSSLNHYNDK